MSTQEVWVIDDDASIRWVLVKALERAQYVVRAFENGSGIAQALHAKRPDLIITDIRMPGIDGLSLLERLHQIDPNLPVIVMTAHTDLDSAVASYQGGAFEYLPKPFDIDDALRLIHRAVGHRRAQSPTPSVDSLSATPMLGEAPAMQDVFRAIGRLASSNMNVLICGESGTGKELVARALYDNSPRADQPFVAINTAAIPAELLESELFGHERGAFTGAHNQRRGRFEQANGGTLFLDEIGDMPALLQTRLLRVLSDGHYYRVGGHEQIKADVRVIAATNQNLEEQVKSHRFREDLFHRLNVIRITLPALRERREDIPVLLHHFMCRIASELNVDAKSFSDDALNRMRQFHWPGNVRQLENVARWLTVMAPGQLIAADDLPPELAVPARPTVQTSGNWQSNLRHIVDDRLRRGDTRLLETLGAEFERVMIEAALTHTGGHKQEAARCLGWGRNTLTRKLKEHAVQTPR